MTSEIIEKQIFTQFPYYCHINSTNLMGIFEHNKTFYNIELSLPNWPPQRQIKNINLKITKGFDIIDIPTTVLNQLNENAELNILEFLKSIENELIEYDKTVIANSMFPNCGKRMQLVLKQIKLTRRDEFYQIFVSSDYRTICIKHFLEYSDQHYLKLLVNDKTLELSVIEHSLPELSDGDIELFKNVGTIELHLTQFLNYLQQLQTFYQYLRTIDDLCFVVDPVKITTKSISRIFKIEENIYVKVIIDPLSPTSIVTHLIGPTNCVEKFRKLYEQRISNWDADLDVHANLLRIFGLSHFPMKPERFHGVGSIKRQRLAATGLNELNTTANDDDDEESLEKLCGICYSYRLDNQIPYVSCDNEKCFLIYHIVCLKKWFTTLPESKTFLNVTFGTCPYCKTKLSTSFINLLEE